MTSDIACGDQGLARLRIAAGYAATEEVCNGVDDTCDDVGELWEDCRFRVGHQDDGPDSQRREDLFHLNMIAVRK